MPKLKKDIDYRCTNCGVEQERDKLTVKRAIFFAFGEGGKQKRSRTVAWLCPTCTEADNDWNRKPGTDSPMGVTNTPKEEEPEPVNA